MSGETSTVEGLRDELEMQLALVEHRALIVLVEAPDTLDDALDALLAELRATAGLPAEAVVRAEAEPAVLRALNHDREIELRSKRLIWLRARQPADVRTIRDNTPDLTAAVDLYRQLEPPAGVEGDWLRCRDAIAALMAREHAHMNVGLPIHGEWPTTPVHDGHVPLVEWPDGGSNVLVVGGPGTGKSTALRHLAWTYATAVGDPLGVGRRLPIRVSLREWVGYPRNERPRDLMTFVVESPIR